MDEYQLLRLAHVLGLVLMGAGLVGVFVCDLRSRQCSDLALFSQMVNLIALFYDGIVVPGALLLLGSGVWMIANHHGGWEFLDTPWLVGMVALFAFEFIEGNTVTRLYFLRMRRLCAQSLEQRDWTAQLLDERGQRLASFTHFLDLPMLFAIVALGVLRPTSWSAFLAGCLLALSVATFLFFLMPRLYPWRTPLGPARQFETKGYRP
ncbi:conserved membrane hypothetical protein [Rhodospirillaceae bacterium LM-1]|nr:conserved membrane hypothetical protein [Rhodospirillaceae bacterium LM-1]